MFFSFVFTDCYDSGCDLLNYSDESCPKSNHTLEFENRLRSAHDCFNATGDIPSDKNTTGNNTCSHCTDQYNDLSNYYNGIRLKTSDKFCFSIKYWVSRINSLVERFCSAEMRAEVDIPSNILQMNTTQQHWANHLKCCQERVSSSLEDFSLASSLSITLSIAFYIFTFIWGKRKERVQDIPDDLMPPQDADESSGTIMNISPDEPTTSESATNRPTDTKKQNNWIDAPSSDDDDNNLPVENPNLIEIGQ